jgi:hypothetical protein
MKTSSNKENPSLSNSSKPFFGKAKKMPFFNSISERNFFVPNTKPEQIDKVKSNQLIQRKKDPGSQKTQKSVACDIAFSDEKFKRTPPSIGAYSEKEYSRWWKHHPKATMLWGNRTSKSDPFTKTAQWFWDHCYFYSGRIYGGMEGTIIEIWLNNKNEGTEMRVYASIGTIDFKQDSQTSEHVIEIMDKATYLVNPLIDRERELIDETNKFREFYETEGGDTADYYERLHKLADIVIKFHGESDEVGVKLLELKKELASSEDLEEFNEYLLLVGEAKGFDIWEEESPPHMEQMEEMSDEPIDFSGEN